jgi:PTH2 family peptidyl-tRNA hydrolase
MSESNEIKMRQLIIVRKDLNMSIGKTAVQCCHASQAWILDSIAPIGRIVCDGSECCVELFYKTVLYYIKDMNRDIYNYWIKDIATKTICGAKNKIQLLKAKTLAEKLGLKEGEDFFLIYDRCLTELQAEEQDERGGKTLTCIGFKPLPDETIQQISRKYQLL